LKSGEPTEEVYKRVTCVERVGLEPTTDGLWEHRTTSTTPSTRNSTAARACLTGFDGYLGL